MPETNKTTMRQRLYCLYQVQTEKLEKLSKFYNLSLSGVIRKLIDEAYANAIQNSGDTLYGQVCKDAF